MIKAAYKQKHLVGVLITVSEDESTTIIVGSTGGVGGRQVSMEQGH